jgi:hypothetical protein
VNIVQRAYGIELFYGHNFRRILIT